MQILIQEVGGGGQTLFSTSSGDAGAAKTGLRFE